MSSSRTGFFLYGTVGVIAVKGYVLVAISVIVAIVVVSANTSCMCLNFSKGCMERFL